MHVEWVRAQPQTHDTRTKTRASTRTPFLLGNPLPLERPATRWRGEAGHPTGKRHPETTQQNKKHDNEELGPAKSRNKHTTKIQERRQHTKTKASTVRRGSTHVCLRTCRTNVPTVTSPCSNARKSVGFKVHPQPCSSADALPGNRKQALAPQRPSFYLMSCVLPSWSRVPLVLKENKKRKNKQLKNRLI